MIFLSGIECDGVFRMSDDDLSLDGVFMILGAGGGLGLCLEGVSMLAELMV